MWKLLTLISVTALCGCATMPVANPKATDIVKQVQNATVSICGFLPIASAITQFIGTDLRDALSIAQAICAAAVPPPTVVSPFHGLVGIVEPAPARPKRGTVKTVNVRGILVRGKYVN